MNSQIKAIIEQNKSPDNPNKKLVTFHDTEKRQAELLIRLHYDGLNQSEFFRGMITGYLNKDPNIIQFLEALKENLYETKPYRRKRQSRVQREKINKEYEKEQDIKKKFALDDYEIDSIFDEFTSEQNLFNM